MRDCIAVGRSRARLSVASYARVVVIARIIASGVVMTSVVGDDIARGSGPLQGHVLNLRGHCVGDAETSWIIYRVCRVYLDGCGYEVVMSKHAVHTLRDDGTLYWGG
jgi:hypothetical protein